MDYTTILMKALEQIKGFPFFYGNVTSIQFEDGSRKKFIITVEHQTDSIFIDLTNFL